MNPITVSYRWSAEEMLLLQSLHRRHSAQYLKFRRKILGAGLVALVLAITTMIQHESLSSVVPCLLLVLSGMLLASPFFTRRAVLKMYKQKPDRDMLITYELSEDRLACRTEVGSSNSLWRVIRSVQRIPEGFLIYPTESTIHWLPTRGFHIAADVEQFAQFAQAHLQGFEHIPNSRVGWKASILASKKLKKFMVVWLTLFVLVLMSMSSLRWTSYRRLVMRGTAVHGTVSVIFPQDKITIRYSYEVAGRLFRGQGPVGPPNGSAAQLSVGQTIVVYCDPLDPGNSAPGYPLQMLHHETASIAVFSLVFPTLMIGFYWLLIPRFRWKQKQTIQRPL
jgi:hypothetical protein